MRVLFNAALIRKLLVKHFDRQAVSRGAVHHNDGVGALYWSWGGILINHMKGEHVYLSSNSLRQMF